MRAIVEQINWRVIGIAGAVIAVGAAASYGFLDADTRNMVIAFLIGGGVGVAAPTSGKAPPKPGEPR